MSTFNQPVRPRLPAEEVQELMRQGTLATFERLERTRFFDGKFLTARDLIREQEYFLRRQSSLGRALGAGVIDGLMVEPVGPGRQQVRIQPGLGLAPSGEMISVPTPLTIDLGDVPTLQRLNRAFGLDKLPRPPARARTGLYVVALRGVEYSANPITSYPTSVSGKAGVEDGVIVEGVAVSLVPFRDWPGNVAPEAVRAEAAYSIFVEGQEPPLTDDLLPLAMIAVSGGDLQWVDPFLARREIGDSSDALGMGFAPRPLRAAFLRQYANAFNELRATVQGRIVASRYFRALPAAGPLDPNTVDPQAFTQSFFPPDLETQLSVIPEDELAALVEESLLLPPIDLTAGRETLQAMSVLILVPLPRRDIYRLSQSLQTVSRAMLPPAVLPGGFARLRPYDGLIDLVRKSPFLPTPAPPPATTAADEAWRNALAAAGDLWFVRRRSLAYSDDLQAIDVTLIGGALPVPEPPPEPEPPGPPEPEPPAPPEPEPTPEPFQPSARLAGLLSELQLVQRFNTFLANVTPATTAPDLGRRAEEIVLDSPVAQSSVLTYAFVAELAALPRVTEAEFELVVARLTFDKVVGGWEMFRAVVPEYETRVMLRRALGNSGMVPELALLTATVGDRTLIAGAGTEMASRIASSSLLEEQAAIAREMIKTAADQFGIEVPFVP